MRLFADECVAGTIIRRLRSEGFDVVAAADVCPTADDDAVLAHAYQDGRVLVVAAADVCPTADDDAVLAHAYQDGRVLITADKDFGELVVRLGHRTYGVISLALGDLAVATRADIVAARLAELGDRIRGNFVTIEPGRVRIRLLPAPKH